MNDDDTAVLGTIPAGPRDEDLAVELARAAPRRWWNRGTVALGGLVLVVGGFLGGLQAQKHWGTAETAGGGNRPGGFAAGGQNRAGYGPAGGFGNLGGAQAPGGQAQGGQAQGGQAQGGQAQGGQAQGAAAGSATTGTVKLVNGTTIYVQTADGSVVTVRTDGATSVSTAAKGKLADVKAGQKVTVQGTEGTDGAITATTVTAEKK